MITIIDLDRPFDGFNAIEPTAMTRTQLAMEHDFQVRYQSQTFPCDDGGLLTAVQ